MPTDPSVIRLMAVLAVLVSAPLSLALGLRALELAGLLRARREDAGPVVRLASGPAQVPAPEPRGPGAAAAPRSVAPLPAAACLLGALALAVCAALAVLTAVRGQV
jgi:hypothetical protein